MPRSTVQDMVVATWSQYNGVNAAPRTQAARQNACRVKMGPFSGVSGQAKDVVNPVGSLIGASNRSGANLTCSLAPINNMYGDYAASHQRQRLEDADATRFGS